ncbi:tyrosine-type recombinase/integrase [Thiocapsa sp.]|uniref:tyrosine-type recombinase/integrase n=1 Tax=Thiocapsa sp. TaxID=2024551 RepID=UPI003593F129
MFFFTLYGLGLRLGEGLALTVADIDAACRRVHIRASKGNKDRFVPLGDDAGLRPVRSRRSRTRSRVWRRASCPPSRFRAIRARWSLSPASRGETPRLLVDAPVDVKPESE